MTAVASTRQNTNRSARQSRSTSVDSTPDYADVPVLLRLPNLDRPGGTSQSDIAVGTIAGDDAPSASQSSAHAQRANRTPSNTQTTAGVDSRNVKPATAAPKVLAMLWRAGIVIAAIGLVVLAYRIINGPPRVDGDIYSNLTNDDASFTSPTVTLGQVTPVPSATIADNLAAPKLSTPELATSLVSDQSHTEVPALEGMNPWAASEAPQPNPSVYTAGASNISHGDTEPAVEYGGAQARPWNESTLGGNEFAQPANRDGHQRPWASESPSPSTYAATASPDSPREYETASAPTYPETDRRTWRTPQQWDEAASYGQPAAEPNYDAWQENSRSAARLGSEIEQPPLRR